MQSSCGCDDWLQNDLGRRNPHTDLPDAVAGWDRVVKEKGKMWGRNRVTAIEASVGVTRERD